jgi:hypothetical protein
MIAITIARIIVCPHYKQRRSNGSVKYKPYWDIVAYSSVSQPGSAEHR